MFRKFISLTLSFILFLSCGINAAGEVPLEDIKILISMPEKYSKDGDTLLSAAVLAGMAQYDRVFEDVITLKNKLAVKESLLEEIRNTRILDAGRNMSIQLNGTNYKQNFPALDNHYKWQKANVYEPAFEEVKKYRLAYIEYYKSPEIKAQWEAAEKRFAAIEKDFKSLERQWSSIRNNLLKAPASAQEAALKKEIAVLKREITSKQNAFINSQYQILREEYNLLISKLRDKAGLFLPEEFDKFVIRIENDLKRFQAASGEENIAFARRALKESIDKFSSINPSGAGGEIKYFKESFNKFFNNISRRLNLKTGAPLIAAAGIAVFMLSAQSSQAAGISQKNVIVARAMDYSYKETPQLMLANTISLSKYYGPEAVANVVYENQEYLPLIKRQIETLKYMNEESPKEKDLISDVVISSSNFQLPVYTDLSF